MKRTQFEIGKEIQEQGKAIVERKPYQRWTFGEIMVSAMGGWDLFCKQYPSNVKRLDFLLEMELRIKKT